MSFQAEKDVVRALHAGLARATPKTVSGVLAAHVRPNWHWRGMHPFHDQHGPEAVAAAFWGPFLPAMSRVQRRADIFFAGRNAIDGGASTWVVSTGHLMGLFDAPFLGIRPTRRIAILRYVEFNRVKDGRITDTFLYCDLLHLMTQAGLRVLPPQTGAHLVPARIWCNPGLQRMTGSSMACRTRAKGQPPWP